MVILIVAFIVASAVHCGSPAVVTHQDVTPDFWSNQKSRPVDVMTIEPLTSLTNAVFDAMLSTVNKELKAKHLDPYEVVWQEALGMKVDGWIGGLSSLQRFGNVSVVADANKTMSAMTSIRISNLTANLSFIAKVLGLLPVRGSATAKVDSIKVKVALRVILHPVDGLRVKVDELSVKDIGKVEVTVSGLAPLLDSMVEVMADLIANLLKYFIPLIVNGELKVSLQEVIDNLLDHSSRSTLV